MISHVKMIFSLWLVTLILLWFLPTLIGDVNRCLQHINVILFMWSLSSKWESISSTYINLIRYVHTRFFPSSLKKCNIHYWKFICYVNEMGKLIPLKSFMIKIIFFTQKKNHFNSEEGKWIYIWEIDQNIY